MFYKGGFFMEIKLSAIKTMENKASSIPGVISFAQGTPSFDSHKLIRKAAIAALRNNKVDKYSQASGIRELRALISKKLLEKGMLYDAEREIVATAGAMEALSSALLAIGLASKEVIILTPTYPYYEKIIKMAGGRVVYVALDEKSDWKLNIEILEKKITDKTCAIILCNPNNPTGSILGKDELLTIGKLAKKHKFIIIQDDVYENFYFGKHPPFNLCKEKEFKKQIIRIVSFSKDFALCGWRIGFLHSSIENIDKILPIHDNLINCAPVISQYAALEALKNEHSIITEYRTSYKKRRQLMGDFLKECRDYLEYTWPMGAYYFFPKILGIKNTEGLCFDILKREKVAVVPGDEFGLGGEGHIRLCFGKREAEIIEGMKRLVMYFKRDFKKFREIERYPKT